MKRKLLLLIAIYIVLPIAVVVGTYSWLNHYFLDPLDPSDTTTVIFEVSPQKTFRDIAADLELKHFVRNKLVIRVLAKLQGKDTKVMAGEYEFSPSMSPQQILDAMVDGRMILRQITVREGLTMNDIGPLLEEAGIVSKLQFEAALRDAALREELAVPADSFEGYLYPETYRIQRNTPARKVIQIFRSQLNKIWNPEWTARLAELELTKHQVLTLASIIEKESGNVDEQPLVSSVFYNRLRRGMRLQSDPTVIYGIPNFNGNITKDDLLTKTPYNTYVISGLPPGPIANPGYNAIKSALYPATTRYLYFVGNGQGKHIFSETLEQHNEAVNTFQRGHSSATSSTPDEVMPLGTLPEATPAVEAPTPN